jgi:hypothetical protein
MRNLLRFSLMITLLFVAERMTAQSRTLDGVEAFKKTYAITIKNNNTVVGYAFFYRIDKVKKAYLYRLEIMDENLKTIGTNEFEGSKGLELEDAVYESEHIMLAFTDTKKTDGVEKLAKIFDLKGKQTGEVTYDPEKVKKGMFGASVAEEMSRYYNGYNNVEGKGFVCVFQSKAKVGGADIQMIDKTGKLKWEKNISADKGDRMDLYLTTTTPNALVFYSIERNSITAKESKNFLVGLDPQTGKELYRKPMEIKDYAWEPMLFKTDDGISYKMVATLSHEEDKFYTAKPIGFNIADFNDKTGEFTNVKDFTFEKDLSNVLDMKNESKSEDGYIKMHNIVMMDDGSKVLVGEFFRKTVSALGMASRLLSRDGGMSSAQASIGDMFLLRLDKNNKAVALDRIEKSVDRVPVPEGVPIGLIQRVLGLEGNFGYLYTDYVPGTNKQTVIAEGRFDGEKFGRAAITFDEKKGFTVKKFNVDSKGKDRVFLKRAKPGHVVVVKYSSKEKTITINLERVD